VVKGGTESQIHSGDTASVKVRLSVEEEGKPETTYSGRGGGEQYWNRHREYGGEERLRGKDQLRPVEKKKLGKFVGRSEGLKRPTRTGGGGKGCRG